VGCLLTRLGATRGDAANLRTRASAITRAFAEGLEAATRPSGVSFPRVKFAGLAFEHGELMPEGQIIEHESGMGLEASEQATQHQKELDHDEANFGRQCRRIKVFGGLRDLRYPHQSPSS